MGANSGNVDAPSLSVQAGKVSMLAKMTDRKLESLATCGLGLGIAAALCGVATVSDYLVAGSILTHMACRFDRWWTSN